MKNLNFSNLFLWILVFPIAAVSWYISTRLTTGFFNSIIDIYQSNHPYEYWENQLGKYPFWLFGVVPQFIPPAFYLFIGTRIAPNKKAQTAFWLIVVYVVFWIFVIASQNEMREDVGILIILIAAQSLALFISFRIIKAREENKNIIKLPKTNTEMFHENRIESETDSGRFNEFKLEEDIELVAENEAPKKADLDSIILPQFNKKKEEINTFASPMQDHSPTFMEDEPNNEKNAKENFKGFYISWKQLIVLVAFCAGLIVICAYFVPVYYYYNDHDTGVFFSNLFSEREILWRQFYTEIAIYVVISIFVFIISSSKIKS